MKAHQPKPQFKGIPFEAQGYSPEQIANAGWNILQEDLPLPLAVIKEQALLQNSKRMKQWLDKNKLFLAPHIKTTMSPELVAMQLDDGAWGLTVANVLNLRLAADSGAKHIIFANQLVGRANFNDVQQILSQYPDLTLYIFIDSVAVFELLQEAMNNIQNPPKILIELGAYGGRCGIREPADAVELTRLICSSNLEVVGFSAYEAVFNGSTQDNESSVLGFLKMLDKTIGSIIEQQLITSQKPLIISIGGSEYYDMCALAFTQLQQRISAKVVLRSGCYLFSDSGVYEQASDAIDRRLLSDKITLPPSETAIEVWCYVLSRPEPDLVILGAGKRDLSYDKGLPKPLYLKSRLSSKVEFLDQTQCEIHRINDQHCYLRVPNNLVISPGDMVGIGISHPCTTFDKWRKLLIIDNQYHVISSVETWF